MNSLILYDNLLTKGTLSSSTLASGYDVQNIKDGRPYIFVKFANPGTNYIQIDLDAAGGATYLGICGHNLFTVSAAVAVYYWTGSAWALAAVKTPADNNAFMVLLGTHSNTTKYKITITNLLGYPYVGVAFLGAPLTMEYPADSPRSPYIESIAADSEDSKDGNLLGTVYRYNPIEINHSFSLLTRTWVKDNYKVFWDTHAKIGKQFFYCLDYTTEPENVFFCKVKNESVFETPQSYLNYADSLQLNLIGRR